MKVVKTVIQYILTIILIFSLLAYFFITLISNTILEKQYIMNKIENTNYYSKIYENVKSNFEKYIEQSGFEDSILENIVSEEKVKNDTQIIIDNLYNGANKEIDTQEIKDKINNNIMETLENKNINQTQQSAINTFITHICNEYTETISHFNIENRVYKMYQKAIDYINIAKKVIIIFILLDIFILFMINLKKIYKFVSLIGSSLTATGIFLIITNLFINAKIKIQAIIILNNGISDILKDILTEVLNIIVKNGLFLIIFGIALMFFANLIYNIKEIKTKENN